MNFAHLSSHALTARLGELLATERRTIVAFVWHLAELERRQLHLEMGYSSTFVFCTQHLKLTKASAYRRTTAAHLVTRYPAVAEMLGDGRLSLTTLALLGDVLTDANQVEVLERAAGRTELEVKVLVATLQPQPAPPDLLRRLPAPSVPVSDSQRGSGPEPKGASGVPTRGDEPAAELPVAQPVPGPTATQAQAQACHAVAPQPQVPRAAAPQPISADQYVLRITVDRAFVDDLEKLKALLSHTGTGGNVVALLHSAVRRTIAAVERRRRGSDKPRPRRNPKPPSDDSVPTDVKRQVWERDEASCAYVSPAGKRCGATYRLEFHHIAPAGKGGPPTVGNISLRCKAHNQYAADRDYGRDFMNAKRKQR